MHQKATTNASFKAKKVQIWLNLLNKQSLLFTVSKVISQLKVQVIGNRHPLSGGLFYMGSHYLSCSFPNPYNCVKVELL